MRYAVHVHKGVDEFEIVDRTGLFVAEMEAVGVEDVEDFVEAFAAEVAERILGLMR